METYKQDLSEKTKTKVFYHGVDMDGYGAAYAVWKKLGSEPTYLPINHGMNLDIKKGDIVYMVDFSVKRNDMLRHAAVAERITVIDHHKTAKSELTGSGMPVNVKVVFDMKKSGAVLTWEHFHNKKVPEILKYIQDRDLWAWELKGSKGVNLWLFKNIKNFRDLDKTPPIKDMMESGQKLEAEQHSKVMKALEKTEEIEFEGHLIGLVWSETMQSEIGHELAKSYHFGMVQRNDKINKDNYKYELRSQGSFDVSKIAEKYGGGGHRNAAGFSLPKSETIVLPKNN